MPSPTKYLITPGVDYPTGGLSVEKIVSGVTTPEYIMFTGGRVNSLDLTVAQKAIVKAKWGLLFMASIAGTATSGNAGAYVYPSDDPTTGYDCFISINNGQTVRPVTDLSLNITNNVDSNCFVLGSRVRDDLPEGERAITGKVTMYFQDNTEYSLFKNETVVPVSISFAHNGEYLTFDLGEVKLTGSGTPQISGAGLLKATYDLSAFRQTGAIDLTVSAYSKLQSLVS